MTRPSLLALFVLLTGITVGQVNHQPRSERSSLLESAVRQPGVRTVWSKEIARLEGGDSRAIFTGLVIEDRTGRNRQIRGVRIDFLGRDAKRTIHIDEGVLQSLERISHQLSIDVENMLTRVGSSASEGYLGSCEFRDNPGLYPLDFDFCYAGWCSPALRITSPTLILFPGKKPSDLSQIFAAAIDELRTH
jgi:hypothetical protein